VSFATFCKILNSAVVTMREWLKLAAFGSVPTSVTPFALCRAECWAHAGYLWLRNAPRLRNAFPAGNRITNLLH
jgi:hypothetical protein